MIKINYDKDYNLSDIELKILRKLVEKSVYKDYTSNNMRILAIKETLRFAKDNSHENNSPPFNKVFKESEGDSALPLIETSGSDNQKGCGKYWKSKKGIKSQKICKEKQLCPKCKKFVEPHDSELTCSKCGHQKGEHPVLLGEEGTQFGEEGRKVRCTKFANHNKDGVKK